MPSQKGKRAKGVQMTEQQPKILQVAQNIVQMPRTADIVQMPATQDIAQSPSAQDILQMAAQMVDIQPLKRALGGNDAWSLQNGPNPRELTYDFGKMAQSLRKKE